MNRAQHTNTRLFVGVEVEYTPAFGKNTLFVVGVQPIEDIEQALESYPQIEHIYFGANQSFPKLNNKNTWTVWENMIHVFLGRGYWCTLDIDVAQAEGILESGLVEHYHFIPMLSVKLPYIQQLGYNATIKLDDKDFAATNPGVWCHSVHNLMYRKECFTDWSKYKQDVTIN